MTLPRLPRERVPYSAIVDRPRLELPGGARLAVWTIVNVEEWSIERPMPRTVLPPPQGQPLLPDLPNWAWHEYGIRVPLLVGVAPIPSARSARWMRDKLHGTRIPDEYVQRLEKAADPRREGRKICVEVLQGLAEIPGIAGAHVMAPMNFAEIPATIEQSGVLGRKRRAAA